MEKRVVREVEKRAGKKLVISVVVVCVFIILAWILFSVLDKLAEDYYQEKYELKGELRTSMRTAGTGTDDYICTDSDGGIDYHTKGTCTDTSTYTDNCTSVGGGSLQEYYCAGNACAIDSHGCVNGCLDGACLTSQMNNPPIFLTSVCRDINFDKNTNYILNMKSCFVDYDNDFLYFIYTNMSVVNISIIENGTNLTLVPQTNFIGSGYFYINASDRINATQGRVDIDVEEPGDDGNDGDDDDGGCISQSKNLTCGSWVCGSKRDNCNRTVICGNCTAGKICISGACVVVPVITNSSPLESAINGSFSENYTFSINAENHDAIEWYVDGALVGSGTSYTTSGLSVGNHEIKVVVKKGSQVTTRTWSLAVYKDEEKAQKKGILMYFVIVFIILGALILVTVLLLVRNVLGKGEKNTNIKAATQPKILAEKPSKIIPKK